MSVYLSLLVVGLLFVLITRLRPDAGYVTSVTFLVMLIVAAAFRFRVGMDYMAYTDIFFSIKKYGPDVYGNIETGFGWLCKLCALAGGTQQLMFALLSTVTLILIYKGIEYFSEDVMLSMFVFLCIGQLYLNCFNAMRQMLAISIIMSALPYLSRRRIVPYMSLILLSAVFHASALIMVPLYWLLDRSYNKLYVVIAMVAFSFSSRILLQIVMNSGYAQYLTAEHYTTKLTVVNVLYLALSVVIFVCSDYLMTGYRHRNIFINLNTLAMFCFGMYFMFSGTPMMVVVTRISYYFMITYAIILPMVLRYMDGRALQLSYFGVLIPTLCFLFIRATIIKGDDYNLLPFRFNFNLFQL